MTLNTGAQQRGGARGVNASLFCLFCAFAAARLISTRVRLLHRQRRRGARRRRRNILINLACLCVVSQRRDTYGAACMRHASTRSATIHQQTACWRGSGLCLAQRDDGMAAKQVFQARDVTSLMGDMYRRRGGPIRHGGAGVGDSARWRGGRGNQSVAEGAYQASGGRGAWGGRAPSSWQRLLYSSINLNRRGIMAWRRGKGDSVAAQAAAAKKAAGVAWRRRVARHPSLLTSACAPL